MKTLRVISLIIACILLLVAICSCGRDVKKEYKDGVIGEKNGSSIGDLIDGIKDGLIPSASKSYAVADGRYEAEELEFGGEEFIVVPGTTNTVQPRAGLLTAGERRDINNLLDWLQTYADENWKEYYTRRGLYSFNIVPVKVKNGDSSIFNQLVELYSSDDTLVYAARTDINGEAYLYYPEDTSLGYVKVDNVKQDVSTNDKTTYFDINLNKKASEIKSLDLMLMVDTTGSMSDELEYLKVELADMVSRVSKSNEALSIRVSVNFYRDEGDDYVVKYFDFRTDINECIDQISKQYAAGGGDYPEAVHTALENVVTGHEWREEAAKICFFVLDAPPHTEDEIQGINANILKSIKIASEKGIRIVPVASSGVDKDTEYILRSFALMTGGTYIFLTNHSGIGGDHLDPSVDDYKVEPLNECMIRVICEYCGLEYVAEYTYTEPVNDNQGQYEK